MFGKQFANEHPKQRRRKTVIQKPAKDILVFVKTGQPEGAQNGGVAGCQGDDAKGNEGNQKDDIPLSQHLCQPKNHQNAYDGGHNKPRGNKGTAEQNASY